jgi:4-hydroxyphenylpyruvate dioxygenase
MNTEEPMKRSAPGDLGGLSHADDDGAGGLGRGGGRTSIATVCLAGTLEEKLRAAADAGFDGVELFEPDLLASPLSPEQVRDLARELGLSLDLYQPFRDLEAVDEQVFEDALRRLEAKCALMARLGMDLLLVCSNVGTATRWEDEVAVAQLARAADVAARHGVRLAYEALAWGRYVNTYRHAWSLVKQADRPNLGVCLDSFHVLSRFDTVEGISEIPGEKIFFVQMADAPIMSLDVLDWSRHHRNFPGEGGLDVVGFLAAVLRSGYSGPISLEVFSDVYRQTDTARTARAAHRSLQWLERSVRGIVADRPRGWDFAELRVEDPDRVVETLKALGFRDRGVHRTKDVRLLTMGQARVVLHERPARAGDDRPSGVVSVGLQMQDPAETARLARTLRYPLAWRANRADEMVLHGIESPAGTEVFLAPEPEAGQEPGWVTEYGEGSGGPGPEPEETAGSVTIDHVNLAQPWRWFDESLAFHRTVLGLESDVSADVASPQGLVRSQVMRTPDGAVRIPLNVVPQSRAEPDEAVSGAAQRRLRAAYPQHVAFLVADAVAAAKAATERGLRMLPVPDNYYEDLSACFGLDPETVSRLRRYGVMYDRDAQGEFLHFYTRTVGSVFFEIVERRAGYEGYGAASAPVRMAAQYDVDRM